MHKNGHIGAALLVYSPLGFLAATVADPQLAFLGAVVSVGLAMLPDIDMRIPIIQHRGPTHTVWFALLVGIVLGIFGGLRGARIGLWAAVGGGLFGFLLGTLVILSHIAADALTPAGVTPFAPVDESSYSYNITRASNPVTNYLILAAGLAASILALATANALN